MIIDLTVMFAREFGHGCAGGVAIGLRPVAPAPNALLAELSVQHFENGVTQQAFAAFFSEGTKRVAVFARRKRLIAAPQRRIFFRSCFGPIDESLRVVVLPKLAPRQSQICIKRVEEEPAGGAIG